MGLRALFFKPYQKVLQAISSEIVNTIYKNKVYFALIYQKMNRVSEGKTVYHILNIPETHNATWNFYFLSNSYLIS